MPTQTDRGTQPHPAAHRIRVELEALASALAGVQLAALLTSEERLAAALADIGRRHPDGSWDADATRRELALARAALTRCRRLGSTMGDLMRVTLSAQGHGADYGRTVTGGRAGLRSLEVTV